jgi:hypothetical protein
MIMEMHTKGMAVVEIAIRTGAPCSIVIETIKEKESDRRA